MRLVETLRITELLLNIKNRSQELRLLKLKVNLLIRSSEQANYSYSIIIRY